MNPRFWGIVPAAGVGRRMGSEIPKQYLLLRDRAVIEHSIARLLEHPRINKVLVALAEDDDLWETLGMAGDARIQPVSGGAERCHSVLNALRWLETEAGPEEWVLVHDAARPCLRAADLQRLIEELEDHPVGGILAGPLHDTVKRTDREQRITQTLERESLWRAFTPQMFRLGILRESLEHALKSGRTVTDEASAIELAGLAPLVVEGAGDNIKITRPEDLELAALFLKRQQKVKREGLE